MKPLDDTETNLPAGKHCKLGLVVDIICNGFTKVIRHRTQARLRNGHQIVLCDSCARGDWTEDPIGRYSRTMMVSSS